MKWHNTNLCYCQNIHPANRWDENFHAIANYAKRVKDLICPHDSFGLGLRLSMPAAQELLSQLDSFKNYLQRHNMYVFTINGFPYGEFYSHEVKEGAYHPDWSHPERLRYTMILANILAVLLPEDAYGSISSLPLCYGKRVSHQMIDNVIQIARHLACIYSETGKTIVLGLEPEPDCCLETTREIIDCIQEITMMDPEAGNFIGACVDTCHLALQQEIPLESIKKFEKEDIKIAKIQLSSALVYNYDGTESNLLQSFNDPVYLHQTRVVTEKGVKEYRDITKALEENPSGKWLVHFHVPLYYSPAGKLQSTSHLLTTNMFNYLKNRDYHLEIETYSFNQLPEQNSDIVESISKEYQFVTKH